MLPKVVEPVSIDCVELEESASPQDLAVADHLLAVLLLRFYEAQESTPPKDGMQIPPS